jgi:hypothetical protein
MKEPVHKYGYERFSWKDKSLYFEKTKMVELIPHEKFPKMYHLKFKWRDEPTPEFFNSINAKENAQRFTLFRLNYDVWESHLQPHWCV